MLDSLAIHQKYIAEIKKQNPDISNKCLIPQFFVVSFRTKYTYEYFEA